jgi:predicted dehydrogenase
MMVVSFYFRSVAAKIKTHHHHKRKKTMLRAGILGCGGIANRHAQALLGLKEDVELVACCDIDAAKAASFSQQYSAGKAHVYSDHASMYAAAKLDLAVICLPPFAHSNEVAQAAERGIHLLVEKPISLHSDQAWEMVEQAQAAGIKTQAGFMYRFGEAVDLLTQKQASGEAGKPGLFSASYFCNALHAPWWRERDKSGGQTVEQIIHLFDLMRVLLGEPVSVFSKQANLFHQDVPNYSIEDVSATIATFSNGAFGIIYASNAAIPNKWLKEWKLVSEKLVVNFADWNHATFTSTSSPLADPFTMASDRDVFLAQMQDLVKAIQTGGETRTPLIEGARSLDLVLAAQRSSESHLEVSLSPQ